MSDDITMERRYLHECGNDLFRIEFDEEEETSFVVCPACDVAIPFDDFLFSPVVVSEEIESDFTLIAIIITVSVIGMVIAWSIF